MRCCGMRWRRPGRRRGSRPIGRRSGTIRLAPAHAGRLPAPVRAELLEGYSVEAYLSGLSAEAVAARRAALELWEAAGDRERVGEGLRWLSRLYWWDGSRQEAETAAARAIAVLEHSLPGRQLAMAYSNQSQLDMLAEGSWRRRWAGPGGRSSWPSGWTTRRRSATP